MRTNFIIIFIYLYCSSFVAIPNRYDRVVFKTVKIYSQVALIVISSEREKNYKKSSFSNNQWRHVVSGGVRRGRKF